MSIRGILAVAAVVLAGSAGTADAAAIKLSYTYAGDRVRPDAKKNVKVTSRLEVELSEAKAAKDELARTAARVAASHKAGGKFGDGQWSAVSANQLRRTFDQPQSTVTMTITFSEKTCALDVQWALKPGFAEYRLNNPADGTTAFFADPKLQKTTCAVR